jgi:hypothetical protein
MFLTLSQLVIFRSPLTPFQVGISVDRGVLSFQFKAKLTTITTSLSYY